MLDRYRALPSHVVPSRRTLETQLEGAERRIRFLEASLSTKNEAHWYDGCLTGVVGTVFVFAAGLGAYAMFFYHP